MLNLFKSFKNNNKNPQRHISTATIELGLKILTNNGDLNSTMFSKVLAHYYAVLALRSILDLSVELSTMRNFKYKKVKENHLQFLADILQADNSWANDIVIIDAYDCYADFDFFIKNIDKINDKVLSEISNSTKEKVTNTKITKLVRDWFTDMDNEGDYMKKLVANYVCNMYNTYN